jgi:hypothetical protein
VKGVIRVQIIEENVILKSSLTNSGPVNSPVYNLKASRAEVISQEGNSMLGSKFKPGRLSNFVQKAGTRRTCKIYRGTGIYSQLVKLFSVDMRFNCMYYYNTCIYMTVIILDSLFKVQDLRQLEK